MTKPSKHTPGPWKVGMNDKTMIFSRDGVAIVEAVSDARRVVSLKSEREANALLIAAAPELLEALKVCSAELFAQCADHPRAMLFVKEARAAITKAEGETNE